MATIRLTCAYCSEPTRLECSYVISERPATKDERNSFAAWLEAGFGDQSGVTFVKVGTKTPLIFYTTGLCPECKQVTLLKCIASEGDAMQLRNSNTVGVDFNAFAQVLGQAPAPTNAMSPHVPSEIREVLGELEEDFKRGRNAGRVLAGCRSVLDVALQRLGQTEGSRAHRIEALAASGALTRGLSDWAKQLWKDGHEGVHELKADGHPIGEHIAFLKLFVEVAFVIPKKIEASKPVSEVAG